MHASLNRFSVDITQQKTDNTEISLLLFLLALTVPLLGKSFPLLSFATFFWGGLSKVVHSQAPIVTFAHQLGCKCPAQTYVSIMPVFERIVML